MDGPFAVAVAVSEDHDDGTKTQLTVYGSYIMFTEDITNTFSLGNVDMLTDSLTWMCDGATNTVSIAAKSMDVPQNTIQESKSNIWTMVYVVLIPLVVVIAGFVVWYRRRKA